MPGRRGSGAITFTWISGLVRPSGPTNKSTSTNQVSRSATPLRQQCLMKRWLAGDMPEPRRSNLRCGQPPLLVRCALTVALALLVPAATFAQSTMAGVVRDSSGGVLPGVTVEAASPALIEKIRTAVTDGQGQYRIVDLRPGTYSVTFTLLGFSTFKREGIVLPAAFTATVNAELAVGALEETITVSGEVPTVDTQSTAESRVLSSEILTAVPTGRIGPQSYSLFIPGVVNPAGFASGLGPFSVDLQYHGAGNHNVAVEGFSTSRGSGGRGHYYMVNQGTVQEVVVATSGAGADQQVAGLVTNVVPREGGNTFSGTLYYHYTNENFVGDNLTPELEALGVSATAATSKSWDFNPAVGGPIKRDKLWFFGSFRANLVEQAVSTRYNLTPTAWVYTPDPSRPSGYTKSDDRSYSLRLTSQATTRNKVSVYFDYAPREWYNRSVSALVAPEASTYSPYLPNYLMQLTWKAPVSNRLLFEAGVSYQNSKLWLHPNDRDPLLGRGPAPDLNAVSALDEAIDIVFRCAMARPVVDSGSALL